MQKIVFSLIPRYGILTLGETLPPYVPTDHIIYGCYRGAKKAPGSNHMSGKVRDEVTYPFLKFNGCIVEFQEWISNFVPHFIMDIITYPRHKSLRFLRVRLLQTLTPYVY